MDTEKRCIFCNSKSLKIVPSKFAPFVEERMFLSAPKLTSAVLCKKCGIFYSSYRPNCDEMARQYKDYRGEEYVKQRHKHEPHYTKEYNDSLGFNEEEINRRNSLLQNFIRKYLNVESIHTLLDWGGDKGQFIPDCFSNAKKYVYDISEVPSVEGVTSINDENLLKEKTFDLVICAHVLEHVDYPISIINKLTDYCKDGGWIYIEVPNESLSVYDNGFHEHITRYQTCTFVELMMINNNLNFTAFEEEGRIAILFRKQRVMYLKRIIKTVWLRFYLKIIKIKNFYKKIVMLRHLI